jgi:hypothetical protein
MHLVVCTSYTWIMKAYYCEETCTIVYLVVRIVGLRWTDAVLETYSQSQVGWSIVKPPSEYKVGEPKNPPLRLM